MKNLVILGCGDVGRYVLHAITEINQRSGTWNVLGFIDDNDTFHGKQIEGIPVLGESTWVKDHPDLAYVIALSEPKTKQRLSEDLRIYGCTVFPSIVHPNTWIARNVTIGEGTIIYPGTSINVDSKIGKFVMINMNCAIGHDVVIEDYTFFAPNVGIGGNSHISTECNVGLGASIIQSIDIGKRTMIGAGAVVINSVGDNQTVVGVPAKPMKR
jgi:sugar O-acyltransferase (sialic acid O-acetyltransferase NeuD family)